MSRGFEEIIAQMPGIKRVPNILDLGINKVILYYPIIEPIPKSVYS